MTSFIWRAAPGDCIFSVTDEPQRKEIYEMRVTGSRPGRAAASAALIIIASIVPASPMHAQALFGGGGELVEVEIRHSPTVFHPGTTGNIALIADIREGWHINSSSPLDEYLIPTVLEIEVPEGFELLGVLYPEPEIGSLAFSEGRMSLYHGTVTFGAVVRTGAGVEPGEYEVRAVLKYQGCNDMTCLEPSLATASAAVRVGTSAETADITDIEIFAGPPFVDGEGRPVSLARSEGGEDSLGDMIESRGLILTFIFIFLGGLALNLTPCVYPLIPITVSYFGGQAGGRASRTFVLALFYVLGMSVTYSVLGTAAAMTGGLFGAALQNPLVIALIAAVLLGLAASMFGFWEIRMPAFLQRRTGKAKQGRWGAIVMGLTVGIVAAPCIGPFISGLLIYVGEIGSPVLGFLMFFTLAWGMGTPFLVLGMLSGSISRLPQSGHWMVWARKIFGFILIMMAVYFARHILGDRAATVLYAVIAASAGIYLGFVDRTPQAGRGFAIVKKAVGIAWLVVAAAIIFRPSEPDGMEWQPYSDEMLAGAREEGRPVMIDFSADWCIPCRELEHETFTDPGVMEAAEGFVRLKVDLTAPDARTGEIKERFGVRGVPTIVFFGRTGEEPEGSRITGFVEPETFLERMKKAGGDTD